MRPFSPRGPGPAGSGARQLLGAGAVLGLGVAEGLSRASLCTRGARLEGHAGLSLVARGEWARIGVERRL